jgi:uncharacterized protein YutE (UPF0331/DUF86 family)
VVDERVIAVKLEQIEQYHSELTSKQRSLSRHEFLSNTTEQRAVERMFENAIQACADLAQHIATREFGFDGSTSKDAMRILSEEDILDTQTADTLITAIGFRNVLAHEYGQIEYEEVYETLQTGLSVYDTYSQQIAQWAKENT